METSPPGPLSLKGEREEQEQEQEQEQVEWQGLAAIGDEAPCEAVATRPLFLQDVWHPSHFREKGRG